MTSQKGVLQDAKGTVDVNFISTLEYFLDPGQSYSYNLMAKRSIQNSIQINGYVANGL